MRLDGKHWHKVGSDWNYQADHATFLLTDTQGTLWATTEEKLMFLPRGARKFSETTVAIKGQVFMAQAPNGSLWLSTGGVIRRLSSAKDGWQLDGPEIRANYYAFLIDSNGGLWGGSRDDGIFYIPTLARLGAGTVTGSSSAIEHYTDKEGLTSSGSAPMFEDHVGDIWVATNGGLNRFRPAKINQLSTLSTDSSFSIVTD
jgi:ligand-binding sensor domain-containing protein